MKQFIVFFGIIGALSAFAGERLEVTRNANKIEVVASMSDAQSQALLAALGSTSWKADGTSAQIVCGRVCVAYATVTEVRDGSVGWIFPAPAGSSYYDLFKLPNDPNIDPGYSGHTKSIVSASGKVRITAHARGGSLTLSIQLGDKLAVGGKLTVYPAAMGNGKVAVLPKADSKKLFEMLPIGSESHARRASSGLGAIQLSCKTDYCEVSLYEMPRAIPGIQYSKFGTTSNVSVDSNKIGLGAKESLFSKLDAATTICRGGACKMFWTVGGAVSVTAMENGTDFLSIRQ